MNMLPIRVRNALSCAGCTTAEEVAAQPESFWRRLPNVGEVTLAQIRALAREQRGDEMTENEIERPSDRGLQIIQPPTPMGILARAVADGNASFEVLERLMALQERWEANEARKAFEAAMAKASAEMPTLSKNREVAFDARGGGTRTAYKHEDLAEVVGVVAPVLGRHGLSHRFELTSEPNKITVTCVISHALGHATRNALTAGADTSGNKNAIQAIGSTITYLSRYALKASLGLAAAHDDDGLGAKEPVAKPDVMERHEKAVKEYMDRPTSAGAAAPAPSRSPAPSAAKPASPTGTAPPPNRPLTIPEVVALETAARAAAARGTSEFRLFWRNLTTLNERNVVGGLGTELRKTMEETDKDLMRDAAVGEVYDPESGEVVEQRT
jgi:hypothetical protein